MKYWIASPFSKKNNGITNYCLSAEKVLKSYGVEASVINNEDSLNVVGFEEEIRSKVGKADILEIPDAWGLFSQSDTEFYRHCRLHAPSKLLQEINENKVNIKRYKREIDAAYNSRYVSSPSLVNTQAYAAGFDSNNIFHYPNPIIVGSHTQEEKIYDYVFVGRNDKVKGIDLLFRILPYLPKNIKVAVLGVDKPASYEKLVKALGIEVVFFGWVGNAKKNQILSSSKICLMLSRFESYSLVCAEAIAYGLNVIAWDVGGIKENFPSAFVKTIRFGDIVGYSCVARDLLNEYDLSLSDFETRKDFVSHNNKLFADGVKDLISGRSSKKLFLNNQSVEVKSEKREAIINEAAFNFFSVNKLKVFGFSMMNEHAEQMWGGLHKLFSDYRYVSRKPLGYNSKFEKNFDIDVAKFKVFDWRFNQEKLEREFIEFDPDLVFVFNGNTEFFENASAKLQAIKKTGFVYSELGWLPQKNNIYLDMLGANGKSELALSPLELLVGSYSPSNEKVVLEKKNKAVLLVLQLPGDTTLDKQFYPKQLGHLELIEYVRKSIPNDFKLLVRFHPRDPNKFEVSSIVNTYIDENKNVCDSFASVDSVVLVNSTVALEALRYNVDIYTLGVGVFSNKGLTIDCSVDDLKSSWQDYIYVDSMRRELFLKYLEKRQLNVVDFDSSGGFERFGVALQPIIDSYFKNLSETTLVEPISYKPAVMSLPNKKKGKNVPELLVNFIIDKKIQRHVLVKRVFGLKLVRRYFSKAFKMESCNNKKVGRSLKKDFAKLGKVQALFPEKTFQYFRSKWVYQGVSKDVVRFCRSSLVANLTIYQQIDVAAMLCEAGCYSDSLAMTKKILIREPTVFRRKQYLRLSKIVSCERGFLSTLPKDEAAYILRLSEAFDYIVESHRKSIDYLIRNKRSFYVVGNSPNVRGVKKGKAINSSGIVFRFNSFDTSLDKRADVGMKTNVWVKSPSFEEVDRKRLSGIELVLITGTNHIDRSPSAYDFFVDFIHEKDILIGYIPPEVYSKLVQKVDAPPSGGMQVLSLMKEISGKIEKERVVGFSFSLGDALKGPNGEANQKAKYSHNWKSEVDYILSEVVK